MSPAMHADEVPTDEALVRRLLTAQFPRWAALSVRPVASAGTVHALYRLGDELVVRLPRVAVSEEEVDKEHAWLPRLAPYLPVAISQPCGRGVPGEGYPYPWSVYTWLPGAPPVPGRVADPDGLARDLAAFVAALRGIDPEGGPTSSRGTRTLAGLDTPTRAALAQCQGLLDVAAAMAAWEVALSAPAWRGPNVWVHADLLPGNLLLRGNRLSAVIDFGSVGLGDPASDLSVAWSLLPATARERFRADLGADEGTWARARGLALSIGLVALPYYQHTNPAFAAVARYSIGEVLADLRER